MEKVKPLLVVATTTVSTSKVIDRGGRLEGLLERNDGGFLYPSVQPLLLARVVGTAFRISERRRKGDKDGPTGRPYIVYGGLALAVSE